MEELDSDNEEADSMEEFNSDNEEADSMEELDSNNEEANSMGDSTPQPPGSLMITINIFYILQGPGPFTCPKEN